MLPETEHSLSSISLGLPTHIRPGFRGALVLVFYVAKCSFHHGGQVNVGKCSFHHGDQVECLQGNGRVLEFSAEPFINYWPEQFRKVDKVQRCDLLTHPISSNYCRHGRRGLVLSVSKLGTQTDHDLLEVLGYSYFKLYRSYTHHLIIGDEL